MSIGAEMFDVLRLARNTAAGVAKDVLAVVLRSPVADPDDEGAPPETEGEEHEWWQHYGFVSKLPKNADAEVFRLKLGTWAIALASRVVSTIGVYGQLSDGDVGLYSTGKQVLRLNADGSVSLVKLTKSGQHLVVTITKDDEIKVVHPDGPYFEMSKSTLTMIHPTAPVTIHSGVAVQIIAPTLVQEVGVVKLHAGASKPMVASTNTAPNVFI